MYLRKKLAFVKHNLLLSLLEKKLAFVKHTLRLSNTICVCHFSKNNLLLSLLEKQQLAFCHEQLAFCHEQLAFCHEQLAFVRGGHKAGTCGKGHNGEGQMVSVATMNNLRKEAKLKFEIGLPGESCPPLRALSTLIWH